MGKVCGTLSGRQCNEETSGSTIKIERPEARNRALEAAQMRQQASAPGPDRRFAARAMQADVVDPKGEQATLDEAGYAEIVALRSNATMKVFITRLADDMGLEIINQEKLDGWVPYFSGHKKSKQFLSLVSELRGMADISGHWVRIRGLVDSSSTSRASGSVSPEDRAVSDILSTSDHVALGNAHEGLSPRQSPLYDLVREDMQVRAMEIVQQRYRANGNMSIEDIKQELLEQYGIERK